jgi:sphinganine C4-monooxygenase
MPLEPSVCPTPFYFNPAPSMFPWMDDPMLSLAAPVVAYWSLSGFFQILDSSGWNWLDKYRIHESAEVMSKNKATKAEVLQAVIFQQAVQTALGWWWIDGRTNPSLAEHCARVDAWRPTVSALLAPALGGKAAHAWAGDGAYWIYWWIIPAAQLLFAM